MVQHADELFSDSDPLKHVSADGYDPCHMPYSVGKPQRVRVERKGEIRYVTRYPVTVNGYDFRLYDTPEEAYYHAYNYNIQSHRATRSSIQRGIKSPHRWLVV